MSIEMLKRLGVAATLLGMVTSAVADDRNDYNRRAATRDLELFQSLDRNADGAVTRAEAQGDINFLPRFNDMEMDMDGSVTLKELRLYLERQYGVQLERGQR